LSLLTTFIASSESSLMIKIADPSNMLLVGLILKCFKACMTIIIFTMNGTANDYFVTIFFLTTTVCGLTYLDKAGYSIPSNPQGEEEEDKVEELKRRIVVDTIMKE
jgi:hypothetical protein